MNEYEKYLAEKLEIAEKKIESLYFELSMALEVDARNHIENRNQVNELINALVVAYDIAYDLMPVGHCPAKIIDYSKELRVISALIEKYGK